MKIIRHFHGSWPQWFAEIDAHTGGGFVAIYIRHGYVAIGTGNTEAEAFDKRVEVVDGPEFCGVTDAVDALIQLRKQGFYYVCPVKQETMNASSVRAGSEQTS